MHSVSILEKPELMQNKLVVCCKMTGSVWQCGKYRPLGRACLPLTVKPARVYSPCHHLLMRILLTKSLGKVLKGQGEKENVNLLTNAGNKETQLGKL